MAYFAYVKHPFSDQGSEHVARRLAIEAGVLTVQGVYFGENQQQHLRMAFANADLRPSGYWLRDSIRLPRQGGATAS